MVGEGGELNKRVEGNEPPSGLKGAANTAGGRLRRSQVKGGKEATRKKRKESGSFLVEGKRRGS